FFFQAEDGIRDSSVTGVQTCALPIWIAQLLSRSMTSDQRLEAIGRMSRLNVNVGTLLPEFLSTPESQSSSRMASTTSPSSGGPKIGRASCRERVWMSCVDVVSYTN